MSPDQKGRGTGSRDTAQAGRPGLRGLRAAVFAAVCVLAALGMHVLAGGPIAGLGTVLAATAVTAAGAYVLARRRRSPGTLLTASFAAQYGMHQLFTSGESSLFSALSPSGGEHGSHLFAGHHEDGLFAWAGMLLAHALVAAVSAWWLDRGETALAALLLLLGCSVRELLWALLIARSAAPPAYARVARPIAADRAKIRDSQVLAWALCRRGPPCPGPD
ncbi:hypothetical protein [Nonomuraea fuscirosea]|uniref:hypothetical protein n=1 Tax=Nonomuraea fuscirosea TaxID=1291556 RepID=UPI0033CBDF9E